MCNDGATMCAYTRGDRVTPDDAFSACTDQIQEMDERVTYLEQVAKELDEYTRELGALFLQFLGSL
jgi:hypothetical protein